MGLVSREDAKAAKRDGRWVGADTQRKQSREGGKEFRREWMRSRLLLPSSAPLRLCAKQISVSMDQGKKTFSRRGAEAQRLSGAFHNEWIDPTVGSGFIGKSTAGYVDPTPSIPER